MMIRGIAARPERNRQGRWIRRSGGVTVTACGFVGSFDEDAVPERRAGSDQRDEVGGIDGTPAVLCRLEEFERQRDPGGPRAGPLGDPLP
jgi:hypothetical protein